ncbi:unnamed protein product [Urochloa humidicola]
MERAPGTCSEAAGPARPGGGLPPCSIATVCELCRGGDLAMSLDPRPWTAAAAATRLRRSSRGRHGGDPLPPATGYSRQRPSLLPSRGGGGVRDLATGVAARGGGGAWLPAAELQLAPAVPAFLSFVVRCRSGARGPAPVPGRCRSTQIRDISYLEKWDIT